MANFSELSRRPSNDRTADRDKVLAQIDALVRRAAKSARAPADRGLWGAPEYVTVASIIDLDESPSLPRVDGDTFAYVAREKLHHMIADGLSSPKRGRLR